MYLNVYVPQLQRIGGVVWYLRGHRGQRFASTAGGGADDRGVRGATSSTSSPTQGVELVSLHQGPAQGRRHAAVPAAVRRRRGRAVRRQGPGEGPGRAHRAAPQPAHRRDLPVDRAIHGDGQPLLLLLRRRRLRPVLPEVLLLLPLQRQAVHQRPRVRQAPACQARHRVRGAGQRRASPAPTPRRCSGSATGCRRRRSTAAAQVAGAAAASVHRRDRAAGYRYGSPSCRPSSRSPRCSTGR